MQRELKEFERILQETIDATLNCGWVAGQRHRTVLRCQASTLPVVWQRVVVVPMALDHCFHDVLEGQKSVIECLVRRAVKRTRHCSNKLVDGVSLLLVLEGLD